MPAEPFLGQIMPFAGNVVPRGWAVCNGALLAIQSNQALFSLIGTTYGGNGVSNFGLPDLRGRAILGASSAGNYPPGTTGGEETVTLQVSQIPSHTHAIQASTSTSGSRGTTPPLNNYFGVNTDPASNPKKIFLAAGSAETSLAPSTNILLDGGGVGHNNLQPYLVISYLIAISGIFPSRS